MRTSSSIRIFISNNILLIVIISIWFSTISSFGLPFATQTFSHRFAEHSYSEEYMDGFKTDILENIGKQDAFKQEAGKSYMNFLFAISNTWGDSSSYIEMVVHGPENIIAPYKYRLLTPLIARVFYLALDTARPNAHESTKAIYSIFAINILFLLATSLLFYRYLKHSFGFNEYTSIIGVALFLTGAPIVKMLYFPLVDIPSLFFSLLIFYAVKEEKYYLYALAVIFGIFAKEVLVFASISLFIKIFDFKNIKSIFSYIHLLLFPIIIYMLQHLLLGGSPVEANYGYDLLKLELPSYAFNRLSSLRGLVMFFLNSFIAFNLMWTGKLVWFASA